MPWSSLLLCRDDSYLRSAAGKVVAIADTGGIIVDRTNFYATSGGQPGDTGYFERRDGSCIRIAGTICGETKDEIIHLPAPGQEMPAIGEALVLRIDWERRHRLMRMHTACHLLTVVCPYPITGAAVGEEESRIDFDMPEAGVTREEIGRAHV